jgi:acyl carrier protein
MDSTTLREFFEVKGRVDMSRVGDDTPLFTSGYVESFTMIDLVYFLEEKCATKLSPADVRLGNLDSIDKIMAFLSARGLISREAP